MLMLQERDEVLMLATNSLKAQNPFMVGLALTAVGNLSTPDMARDLAPEVEKLLQNQQPYVRKKAALCTIRILRKASKGSTFCPELIEDFVERATGLLKDRSHGVLLSGTALLSAVVVADKSQAAGLARLVPALVRMLRGFITAGFTAEHDVAGVTDPFLQVSVLRLMCLLGEHSDGSSELMNDILAQVATTTETAKNAGNAILYECVHTIMRIDSEQGLRLLAINILGRFLLNRDNNMRYVALNTLSRVVAHDQASVQRHRGTIVDCMRDPDVSIRQRALDLIFQLVNESNVESLTGELLAYLAVAAPEHRRDLCSNILQVVEAYAPTKRWRVDTLVAVLSIAGQHCDDSVPAAAIIYTSQAPDLHGFAAHKTFRLLRTDLSQPALTIVGVWCIGEYSDLLMRACSVPAVRPGSAATSNGAGAAAAAATAALGMAAGDVVGFGDGGGGGGAAANDGAESPPGGSGAATFSAVSLSDIVDLLERISRNHFTTHATARYVLTALTKVAGRLPGADGGGMPPQQQRQLERIEALLAFYKASMQLELQARSCEYLHLLRPEMASLRLTLLDRMPVLDESAMRDRRARFAAAGGEDGSENGEGGDAAAEGDREGGAANQPLRSPSRAGLRPPADAAATAAATARVSAPAAAASGPASPSLLDLDDIFGVGSDGGPGSANGRGSPGALVAAGSGTGDLLADIFAGSTAAPQAASASSVVDLLGGSAAAPSTAAAAAPDLFAVGGPGAAASGAAPGTMAARAGGPGVVEAMDRSGLVVTLSPSKPNPAAPETTEILARFINKNDSEVTDLHFQAAVPKYLRLEMLPASGTRLPAAGAAGAPLTGVVEQRVRVVNTVQGQKGIMLKLKIEWRLRGEPVTELVQVSNFPAGY
ncbi:unnamed protein product [Phaeothamnion confervicola]